MLSDFCLLFSFFIIYIFIIFIKLFFVGFFFLFFHFFSFIVFCVYHFHINIHEFLNSEQKKIRFLNAKAAVGGHSSYIVQFKNNDNYFKI